MNWLSLFFVFFLKIKNDHRKYEIKQVYLLENNFWNSSNGRIAADEGYLYAFKFVDKENKKLYPFFEAENCFDLNRATGSRYVEVPKYLAKIFFSCLNSTEVDKNYIRIQFLITDRLINNKAEFRRFKGRKLYLETHMWGQKSTNNDGIINLKYDINKSCVINIKERFKQLMGNKFYKFNELNNIFGFKNLLEELEKNNDFELCHFLNYRECYENFREFFKSSKFFGLKKSDKNENDANDTIMNPAHFIKRIDKMINEDLEKLSGDSEKSMLYSFFESFFNFFYKSKEFSEKTASLKTYKFLIKKCFNDLKIKMQEKQIFFHIKGKYDVDYYFKEIYNQASVAVKKFQKKYEIAYFKHKDAIFEKICKAFYDELENLQEKVIDYLFKSDFIDEQVSKLLGKEVKFPDDIFIIESVICDLFNILTYFYNFCYTAGEQSSNIYHYPLFFNFYHKCKIVRCLKIELKTLTLDGFVRIEAFDEKDKNVKIKRSIHFFKKNSFNREFYFPSDVLKKMNIKKLKITTLHEDFCKIFFVNEYLEN